MTAKPKEFYNQPALLTAANYTAQNLRRLMRDTQLVLVDFLSLETAAYSRKKSFKNKFSDTTIAPVELSSEKLQINLKDEFIKLRAASEEMERALPDKRKPFEGITPTHGFYYAKRKLHNRRSGAKKRNFG